ncbi:ABC transporter substrate-binding protein [Rhodopirellula sp. JC740]|uniref:ABC transporter substrate-binding protein n=1 Tax=Rhodopirellula halodulae TaxID=2894198 RepID=A0ABS8NMQ7_9BACT|nr:ABC transporter substrate-binding protein [Rhodopirellula sp. JC740]MCC9644845.1 ABC transporter substrate-binding protein [Rhodopirellula sp. JC740]
MNSPQNVAGSPTPVSRLLASVAKCTVVCVLLLQTIGCGRQPETTDGLQAISVQLNWYPEVEHGGVYQSVVDGTYRSLDLQVAIEPGGRATPIAPELEMGRSQFAITNADDVVLFRAQGADVVAVAAAVQNHPRCILVRADSGVMEWSDLAGMTLQRQAGRAFLDFLEQRGHLNDVRQVPYHGSITGMLTDPKVAVQAYSVAEPLIAQQQGLEVMTLMVSDLGWNPYSSVLVTTGDMIRDQPEVVRAMVKGTVDGWRQYLQSPDEANAAILQANQHGMTAEALQFGAEQMRPLAMPNGDLDEVGQMTSERWTELVQQMSELGLVDLEKVQPSDCFTTAFLQL